MTNLEISTLLCPYCHHHFHIASVFKKKGSQIEFGSLYCHCDEFPILFGILYLFRHNNKNILILLQKQKYFSALSLALGLGKLRKIFFAIFIQINKKNHISPTNVFNKLLIEFLFKLSPALYHYYFSRHQEKESYLFYLPLLFLNPNSNIYWLDVGSGIKNHYHQLHKHYPHIHLFSLEKYFSHIFLSRIFYPEKNCTYLCSDFSIGPHFSPQSIDIITFIDSLPFIENQKRSLLFAQKNLSKNGLIYITSLVEHLYATDFGQCYPLSRQLISEFFPSPPSFFDEKKLLDHLFQKSFLKNSLLSNSSSPYFRYSLLWPLNKLLPKSSPLIEIPKNTFSWKKPKIQWQNKIY